MEVIIEPNYRIVLARAGKCMNFESRSAARVLVNRTGQLAKVSAIGGTTGMHWWLQKYRRLTQIGHQQFSCCAMHHSHPMMC